MNMTWQEIVGIVVATSICIIVLIIVAVVYMLRPPLPASFDVMSRSMVTQSIVAREEEKLADATYLGKLANTTCHLWTVTTRLVVVCSTERGRPIVAVSQ